MKSDTLFNQYIPSDLMVESKDLGGIPVDILKNCSYLKECAPSKELILLIPGNPGIVGYYSSFIKALHKELNGSAAVWAISHSCHSFTEPLPSCKNFIRCNPLEIEIEHKLRFLEQVVPKDFNITLVGHSIGCYMIQSVMEILGGYRSRGDFPYLSPPINRTSTDQDKLQLLSRINKCYFLFPTIERMKSSPNGKRLWPILNYLQWLPVSLCAFISWLPLGLKRRLVLMAIGRKCVDPNMIIPTVDLLTPRMFGNMLNLAHDELRTVDVIHKDVIDSLKEKIVFYFGVTDCWCPLEYRNDLVKSIPDITNYVDKENIEHAFVLCHSQKMAEILAKFICTEAS